jgi:hypothetical protein
MKKELIMTSLTPSYGHSQIKSYCEQRLGRFTSVKGDHLQGAIPWIQGDTERHYSRTEYGKNALVSVRTGPVRGSSHTSPKQREYRTGLSSDLDWPSGPAAWSKLTRTALQITLILLILLDLPHDLRIPTAFCMMYLGARSESPPPLRL